MSDIVPFEGKQPIVMKSGLVHWVTEQTAARVQTALGEQVAHRFMKIAELSITINTAEVEGVYTMAEYEDLCKVKQGMWQCEYRNWHNKGKRECECKAEFYKRQDQRRRDDAEREANRPLTEDEKKRNAERMQSMREGLRKRGILTPREIATAPVRQHIEADEGMPDFID